MTDSTPAKLRELLLNEFSEEELSALCVSIGIDYEKLAGTGTFGKTRALIDTARSQDKLRALQAKVREMRPAAYEAAGFVTLPESMVMETPPSTPPPSRQQTVPSNRTSLWPWLALALVVLLCTIAGMVLLLPRLQSANLPAMTITTPLATSTTQLLNAAPTETPPAIVEVTDSLDKGAGVLTGTEQAPEAGATALPTTETTVTQAAIVITVTATPTPTGNVVTATTIATETHPSINVIQALNDQLPRFYTGEVDVQALQQYWTGEALRSVVAFGTVRLPRAMRIQPTQRNTIQATYEYRREPALVRADESSAVVSSREFWRYATTANATVICEVRDYVYNLTRVDGQFKVSTFNSRIVESGCN